MLETLYTAKIIGEISLIMTTILRLTKVILIIILVDVLTQTIAISCQYIKVVQRSKRDYFINPNRSCDANTCWKYNSTIVGGYCESDGCCTCRCQGENTTFVDHKQRCMSFASIREIVSLKQTATETEYILGKPRKSCTETCSSSLSTCLSKGHGFTNSLTTLSIFHSLNVSCRPGSFDTDVYYYKDSPAYFAGEGQLYDGRCVGYKKVPETINCIRGHNVHVQRLCPCKAYTDCRYWLAERKETAVVSSSCNNIPVIDLSAKGSIRLSVCNQGNHSNIAAKGQLLKCIVEELKYMRGSKWVSVTGEEASAFVVEVVQPGANNAVLKVKWKSSQDNKYNGIIGFMEIKCDLNGKHLPVCFVFKSIVAGQTGYNSTSQPSVIYETMQKQSTPRTPVSTPSTRNGEEGFDNKKGGNGSSTTIAAAVTASVVLLIIICVITILVIRSKRRQREGTSNKVTQSNPTYGKGPDDTLMLHPTGGAMRKDGERKNEPSNASATQHTYEDLVDKTADKRNNRNNANPILNSHTYETLNTANEPTYYYADREYVVRQMPKQQPIYSVLEESDSPQQDNVYNVLAKPEQNGNDPANGDNVPLYNILNRDPISQRGYNDDERVYHYAD